MDLWYLLDFFDDAFVAFKEGAGGDFDHDVVFAGGDGDVGDAFDVPEFVHDFFVWFAGFDCDEDVGFDDGEGEADDAQDDERHADDLDDEHDWVRREFADDA